MSERSCVQKELFRKLDNSIKSKLKRVNQAIRDAKDRFNETSMFFYYVPLTVSLPKHLVETEDCLLVRPTGLAVFELYFTVSRPTMYMTFWNREIPTWTAYMRLNSFLHNVTQKITIHTKLKLREPIMTYVTEDKTVSAIVQGPEIPIKFAVLRNPDTQSSGWYQETVVTGTIQTLYTDIDYLEKLFANIPDTLLKHIKQNRLLTFVLNSLLKYPIRLRIEIPMHVYVWSTGEVLYEFKIYCYVSLTIYPAQQTVKLNVELEYREGPELDWTGMVNIEEIKDRIKGASRIHVNTDSLIASISRVLESVLRKIGLARNIVQQVINTFRTMNRNTLINSTGHNITLDKIAYTGPTIQADYGFIAIPVFDNVKVCATEELLEQMKEQVGDVEAVYDTETGLPIVDELSGLTRLDSDSVADSVEWLSIEKTVAVWHKY